MHNQSLLGSHRRWNSSAWLAASSQSLPHPGWRVFPRRWFRFQRASLDVDCSPGRVRRRAPLCSDLEWFATQHLGNYRPALGGLLVPLAGANFVFALNAACFLLIVLAIRGWKQPAVPATLPSERFFESFGTVVRHVRSASGLQVVLARNFLFALFISVIPALMPVVGLTVLHFSSSNLGLLFSSMGAGSVIGAVFIIPWLRARFSPDGVTLSANLLIVLAYVLMAVVRHTELFLGVAALAGVGWTLSASELWVAAQRAVPSWARGRMNATVIMVSQGALALGGVIWGSAAAIAGPIYTLLGASVLFLVSLLLGRRLSINVTRNLEARASGVLSISCRIKKGDADSTHKRIARSLNDPEKDYEQQTSRKWSMDTPADFHCTSFRQQRPFQWNPMVAFAGFASTACALGSIRAGHAG